LFNGSLARVCLAPPGGGVGGGGGTVAVPVDRSAPIDAAPRGEPRAALSWFALHRVTLPLDRAVEGP